MIRDIIDDVIYIFRFLWKDCVMHPKNGNQLTMGSGILTFMTLLLFLLIYYALHLFF